MRVFFILFLYIVKRHDLKWATQRKVMTTEILSRKIFFKLLTFLYKSIITTMRCRKLTLFETT